MVGKILMNSIVMDDKFFHIEYSTAVAEDIIGFVVCSDGWSKIWNLEQFRQIISICYDKQTFKWIENYAKLKKIPDDLTISLLIKEIKV